MGKTTREWSVAIDTDRHRVLTCWGPIVTDVGLSTYQREVSLHPDHRGYDELLDFLATTEVQVSTASLQSLAAKGAARDLSERASRMAIVVAAQYHFGLARMYTSYRGARDGSTREVRVFKQRPPAEAWLDSSG